MYSSNPVRILFLLSLFLLSSCSGNSDKRQQGEIVIRGNDAGLLSAGFAAVRITPEIHDTWTDADDDAAYDPDKGDTFTDGNGNGKFDPVWIAGFNNRRAANGVHDDIWARTFVIGNGKTRIAIVSVDVIGFMNNAVNDVRRLIPGSAGISYLVVSSTHSHEGPDLLGLWGSKPFRSGVDRAYLEFVKHRIAESVTEAASAMRPARLEIAEDPLSASLFVTDTRKPEVYDNGLMIIRAVDRQTESTLGTFITWGNHPETLWGKNLLITSDFPHYLRECVEKGIYHDDSLRVRGTGGIAVYATASVGGLMTTSPAVALADPFTGQEFKIPSFEKAEAQGRQLAVIVLSALRKPSSVIDSAAISLVARPVRLPLKNRLYKLAKILNVLDREGEGLRHIWSEIAVFSIGPLSFATFPGEVYPEIVNGGVENPDGADFSIAPLELPPVRDAMPGRHRFILGLANDEIGYIIPKSQWDSKPPFAYGRDKAQYGEENSLGPETAEILHRNLVEMLEELK